METSIPESQIPSETADCYDFPFSTSAVWASKTVKLLRLQGPTVRDTAADHDEGSSSATLKTRRSCSYLGSTCERMRSIVALTHAMEERRGWPAESRAETKVVSTASWARPHNAPYHEVRSRRRTLVLTVVPASRQTRAAALSSPGAVNNQSGGTAKQQYTEDHGRQRPRAGVLARWAVLYKDFGSERA